MSLRTILRKELYWSRHRVVALLFVLVLLPGAFAGSSVFFQSVLPRDAPVAVVGGEDVDADDREITTAALNLFSKPIQYEDRDRAFRDLERERVYAVVDVPPGIADRNVSSANVTVTIDGDMVPYREPSGALVGVLQGTLDRNLDKRVRVTREIRGAERRLSSYLLPTFLMMLVMTFAFAYIPYNLAREESVLDRLRVETSLDAVVAGKLLYFTATLFVPFAVFGAAARLLRYDLRALAPGALGAYLLTFLALAALATAVTFATRFSTSGRLLNVLLLFFFFGFSGLVYPAGFFSPLRRQVVRRVPTHYAMIVARSATLRDLGATDSTTLLAGLVGFLVVALVPLKLAMVAYERGT